MPDVHRRDGRATRARLSDLATEMFLERGFDRVTVAEVAAAAGVSKVTVFNRFARKEDLLLDRGPEAISLIRDALQTRPSGSSPTQALRALAVDLLETRHPLSGVSDDDGGADLPFLRMVMDSPALVARARELGGEIEAELARLLAAEPAVAAPEVFAGVVLGAYRSLLVINARQLLAGESSAALARDHRARLARAFDALDAAAAAL